MIEQQQQILQSQAVQAPDDQRKFHLDSGADPSHLSYPTLSMQRNKNPIVKSTASGSSHAITHVGQAKMTTPRGTLSLGTSVSSPFIKKDLISVHQLSNIYGEVTFRPRHAYFIARNQNNPQIFATETFENGLYTISRHLVDDEKDLSFIRSSPFVANAARKIPWKPMHNKKRK